MNSYRVSFYKDLCNSDGHNFKCLQRQIDVQSAGLSQALELAERLIDNERLHADSVEVARLATQHVLQDDQDHSRLADTLRMTGSISTTPARTPPLSQPRTEPSPTAS